MNQLHQNSKANSFYKIDAYFLSIGHAISELQARFGHGEYDKDQNFICTLSRIVLQKKIDQMKILSLSLSVLKVILIN